MFAVVIGYGEHEQIIVQVDHGIAITGNGRLLLLGVHAHVQLVVFNCNRIVSRRSAGVAGPAILGLVISINTSIRAVRLLQNILHRVRSHVDLPVHEGHFGAISISSQHSISDQLPHILSAVFVSTARNYPVGFALLRILQVGVHSVISKLVAVFIHIMHDHRPGRQPGIVEGNLVIVDHIAVFIHTVFNKGMVNNLLISNISGDFRRFNRNRRTNQTRHLRHQIGNRFFAAVIINIGCNIRATFNSSRERSFLFIRGNPLGVNIPIFCDGDVDKTSIQRTCAGSIGIPTGKVITITRRLGGKRVGRSILIVAAVIRIVVRCTQRMSLVYIIGGIGIGCTGIVQMIFDSLDGRIPLSINNQVCRRHRISAPVNRLLAGSIVIPTAKDVFGVHIRGRSRNSRFGQGSFILNSTSFHFRTIRISYGIRQSPITDINCAVVYSIANVCVGPVFPIITFLINLKAIKLISYSKGTAGHHVYRARSLPCTIQLLQILNNGLASAACRIEIHRCNRCLRRNKSIQIAHSCTIIVLIQLLRRPRVIVLTQFLAIQTSECEV